MKIFALHLRQRFFKKQFSYLALLLMLFASQYSVANEKQYSGINRTTFYNSEYNKHFVGNGFLIKYNNKLYALTVKHTLFEAKTPTMNAVAIEKHIQSWQIHPNQSPNSLVKLGKLLNANDNEAIDMNILSKDWLIFEVEENKSSLEILTLRESPLTKGEQVIAYGCSYAKQESCVQDKYPGKFISEEANNLRINMPDIDLTSLRGLSGSPVLDSNHQVVGIVSNVLPSKSGKGFDFAPANLNYLKQQLNHLAN